MDQVTDITPDGEHDAAGGSVAPDQGHRGAHHPPANGS